MLAFSHTTRRSGLREPRQKVVARHQGSLVKIGYLGTASGFNLGAALFFLVRSDSRESADPDMMRRLSGE
jgi:hypothetical protein